MLLTAKPPLRRNGPPLRHKGTKKSRIAECNNHIFAVFVPSCLGGRSGLPGKAPEKEFSQTGAANLFSHLGLFASLGMRQARDHRKRVAHEVMEKHDASDSQPAEKAMILGPIIEN
jgi:hypothetical protein